MSALSQSDLTQDIIAPVNLFRADFPGYTLRAWTGVGDLSALSQTFQGTGDFLSASSVEGATDALSPRLVANFTALDGTLSSELADYVVRGSRVYLWFALINTQTGALAADPELLFDGRVDVATITAGEKAQIEVECIGALEYAARRTARKRTPGDQESIWPGDKFFEFAGQDGSLRWGSEEVGVSGGGSGNGGSRGGRSPGERGADPF